MPARDRYAHLRANLQQHRTVTAQRSYTWWCLECQLHQADESGLCPLCQPVHASVAVVDAVAVVHEHAA